MIGNKHVHKAFMEIADHMKLQETSNANGYKVKQMQVAQNIAMVLILMVKQEATCLGQPGLVQV